MTTEHKAPEDEQAHVPDPAAQAEQEQADQQSTDEAAAASAPAEDLTLEQQLANAETKAQDNWDKYLRANAEADNIRRRAEREVANARKFAVEKMAKELLSVRDSLEMGLKTADEAEGATPLREGMEVTLKQLTAAMDKFNIKQIDPVGQTFNPEHHEAAAMVPSPDAAPNTVIDVMQKGYLLADRLLRPAMVIVASAPPTE